MSDSSLLSRLEQIPQRLADALDGQPEGHPQPADPDVWAAAVILAHVRASDDILSYRAYVILARDNPPLPAYDDRRWAEVTHYAEVAFEPSLMAFTIKRAELARMLRRVAPAAWERMGTHEVNGPLTLRQVVTALVEHDEEHCVQLEGLKSASGA